MNLKETLILEYLKNVNLTASNLSIKNIIKDLTPILKEAPTVEPVWEDVNILNEDNTVRSTNEVLKSITVWYTDNSDGKPLPRKVDIII